MEFQFTSQIVARQLKLKVILHNYKPETLSQESEQEYRDCIQYMHSYDGETKININEIIQQ
jgi:hypothetical protein